MATYCIPRDPLTWFVVGARRVLLSACTVALVSCGGGQSEPAAPVDSVGPTPAPMPARPAAAPAQLVVGTAQSIDIGASGNPVNLRVVRSANGDGFAVWRADDGTRRNLWANRYRAATTAWGSPINIEASDADIDDFDLTVDASGNATVVWIEPSPVVIRGSGDERTLRRRRRRVGRAGAAEQWLISNPDLHVTSDATGAMLAVFGDQRALLRPGQWHLAAGRSIQREILGNGSILRPGAIAGRQRQCARRLSTRARPLLPGEQLFLTQHRELGRVAPRF